MAIAIIPIILVLIGILIYVLASNAKTIEIGRAMFWAGFIAIGIAYASKTLHIG